jgi:hypothetical protein
MRCLTSAKQQKQKEDDAVAHLEETPVNSTGTSTQARLFRHTVVQYIFY